MEEVMPEGMTLPRELEIYPSQTDSKKIGIYSKYTIKKGVKYGPYKGVRKKIEDVTDHTYSWEIVSPSRKPICLIDASDVMRANWLRFVKSARFYEEQNMIATQIKKNIFYKVIKDIYPGDELLCWFNNSGDVSCNHYSKEPDANLNKCENLKDLHDTEIFKRPSDVKKKRKNVGLSKLETINTRKSNLKTRKRKLVLNRMKSKKIKKEIISDVKERSIVGKRSNFMSFGGLDGDNSEAESTKESKSADGHDATMPVLEKNFKNTSLELLQISEDNDLPDTSQAMQLSPPLLSPIVSEQETKNQNVFEKTVDFNIQTPDVSSTNDVKQIPVAQEYCNDFQIGPEDQLRDKRGRPFYKCKVCGGIFSKQVGLKIHYRKNHFAPKHKGFTRPVKIAHPREKIRTRSVSVTEIVTKRKQAIKMWDDQHTSQQEENLGVGVDTALSEETSGSTMYSCPYCDKQFRYSGWLERHILQHNFPSSKQITCQNCPRTFLSYSHFRAHLPLHGKTHGKTKQEKIKKNAGSVPNLRTHYDKKSETYPEGDRWKTKKPKKLQCDVCGKQFHSRSNCVRHRRLAHNIRIKRRRKENGQQDYFIEKSTVRLKHNASRMRSGFVKPLGDCQSKQQTITAIPEDTPSIAAIFGLASSDAPASSEGSDCTDNQNKQWIEEQDHCQDSYCTSDLSGEFTSYSALNKDSVDNNVSGTSDILVDNLEKDIPKHSNSIFPTMSGQYATPASNETFMKPMAEENYLRNCLTNPNTHVTENKVPLRKYESVHIPDGGGSTLRRVLSSSCKVHGHKTSGKRVVPSYQSSFYNAVAASPWSQVNTPQPYIPRKKCSKVSEDESQVLNLAVKDRRKPSESVLDLTSTQQSLHTTTHPRQIQCPVHPRSFAHPQSFQQKQQRSSHPPPYSATHFSQRMPLLSSQQQQKISQKNHGDRPLSPSARVIFPGMNPEHVHSLNSSITKMTSRNLHMKVGSQGASHSNLPGNSTPGLQPQRDYCQPRSISPSNPVDLMTNRFYVKQSNPAVRPGTLPPPSLPPFAALNQSTRKQSPCIAHPPSGVVPMVPNVHLPCEMPRNSQPKTVKEILEERASKKHAVDKLQIEQTYLKAPNPQIMPLVQPLPNQVLPNVLETQEPQNLSFVSVAETKTNPIVTSSENINKEIPAAIVLGDNSAKTISTFKCNVCEAPFNSMKDLTQHVVIHAKEWHYKCEFCIRLFKDTKDLVEHRSTLHRVGKMYACSVCQREFAYLSNLQTHQRDCHANVQCSYTELGPDELRPINFTVPVQAAVIFPNKDQQNIAKSRISQISDDIKKKSPSKIRNMTHFINHGKDPSPVKGSRKLAPVNPQRHHPFAHHRKLGFLNMMTNQRYESVRNDSRNTCTKCSMVFLDKLEFHKHIMECADVNTPMTKPINQDSEGYEQNHKELNEQDDSKQLKTLTKKYDPNKQAKHQSLPEDKDIHTCLGCSKIFNVASALERHKKKCPNQDKPNSLTSNSPDKQNLIKEQHSCPFCKRNFCYIKSLKKHAIICPQRVDDGIDPLQLIEDAQRKLEETRSKEVSFRKSIHNPFNKAYANMPSGVDAKCLSKETSGVKLLIRKRSFSGKKDDYIIDNDSNRNVTSDNSRADDDNTDTIEHVNIKHEIKTGALEAEKEVVSEIDSEVVGEVDSDIVVASNPKVVIEAIDQDFVQAANLEDGSQIVGTVDSDVGAVNTNVFGVNNSDDVGAVNSDVLVVANSDVGAVDPDTVGAVDPDAEAVDPDVGTGDPDVIGTVDPMVIGAVDPEVIGAADPAIIGAVDPDIVEPEVIQSVDLEFVTTNPGFGTENDSKIVGAVDSQVDKIGE